MPIAPDLADLWSLMDRGATARVFVGPDGRYEQVPDDYATLLGVRAADICGKRPDEVLDAATWDEVRPHVEAALRGEERKFSQTWGGRRFDIHYLPLTREGTPAGFAVTLSDVTELHRAKQQLEEFEQLNTTFLEAIGEGVVVHSPDGRLISLNRSARQLTHLGELEVAGLAVSELPIRLVDRDGAPMDFERDHPVALALACGGRVDEITVGIEHAEETTWVSASAVPLFRPGNDEAFAVVSWFHDITHEVEAHRRESEARRQLVEQNERIEAILDGLNDAIVTSDDRGRIRSVNRAAEQLFGYEAHELVGTSVGRLTGLTPEAHDRHIDRYRATHRAAIMGTRRRLVARRKDGSTFPVQLALSETTVREESVYTAVIRDLTREEELEAQLRQSQKMEAIGTLAGGVAHDFNNVLHGILLGLESVREQIPDESHDDLDTVLRYVQRGRDLVSQILTFARSHEEELQLVEPQLVFKEAVRLLRYTLPSQILFEDDLRGGGQLIQGSATQLHQILVNLCTNAAYEMRSSGGRLRVASGTIRLDTSAAEALGISSGPHLELVVSDTGPGIPPAIAERIFDPFFTTKPAGEGTGLGLSVVHGIVRRHHGAIRLKPSQQGATFQVLLPITEGEPSEDSGPKIGEANSAPAGRALVVDDEPALARMLARILRRAGWEVTELHDSRAALELLRTGSPHELVITDMSMPHVSGTDLAAAVALLDPRPKLITVTGHDVRTEESAHVDRVLSKPFDRRELQQAIADVFAG